MRRQRSIIPTSLLAIFTVERCLALADAHLRQRVMAFISFIERQPGQAAEILVHVRARQPSMGESTQSKIDGERLEISPLVLP